MIVYLENSKDSSKKLLELIYEFNKVYVHNLVALLQTNSEKVENQIKNSTPFTIAAKKQTNKQKLRLYLTRESKDLYKENYRTLLKEITDDRNKWKYIHVHERAKSIF